MIKMNDTRLVGFISQSQFSILIVCTPYQTPQNPIFISDQDVLIGDLDVSTSIQHLILSDMYSAQKLRKEAMKFVCENMKLISSTCDWKKELAGYPSLMAEIIEFLMNEK